jgi:hypothetical protein
VAKQPKSDRRAVLDSIRKRQRSAERARGYAIIGICVVVAVLIVGLAAYQPVKGWWDTRKFDSVDLASIGKAASVCKPVTTIKADGNQQHVPTGQTVVYTTAPPAFGPHWNEQGVAPVAMSRKFYSRTDRPALEALVHNLEHGYTILWYKSSLPQDQVDLIEKISKAKLPDSSRGKFIAAPFRETDGKAWPDGKNIALSHWSANASGANDAFGHRQFCGSVSGEALSQFLDKYPATDAQEPNGG